MNDFRNRNTTNSTLLYRRRNLPTNHDSIIEWCRRLRPDAGIISCSGWEEQALLLLPVPMFGEDWAVVAPPSNVGRLLSRRHSRLRRFLPALMNPHRGCGTARMLWRRKHHRNRHRRVRRRHYQGRHVGSHQRREGNFPPWGLAATASATA
jgi:hypothetical protein